MSIFCVMNSLIYRFRNTADKHSQFSVLFWGYKGVMLHSFLGTKIKMGHGEMFSLFPILFSNNSLFPPGKDPGRRDTLASTILLLSPCIAPVPLGWRPQ